MNLYVKIKSHAQMLFCEDLRAGATPYEMKNDQNPRKTWCTHLDVILILKYYEDIFDIYDIH